MILSAKRIAELHQDTKAWFKKYGYKDIVPAIYYDTNTIAAGAIPASTQFFNSPQLPAISNLIIPNQLPNPMIILAIGIQYWTPTAADRLLDPLILFERCELEFEKDNRRWPSYPICTVGGGSSINAIATSNALSNIGVNGVGNTFRRYQSPIAVEHEQTIRAWLSSDGTAVTSDTCVRVYIEGVEKRRLV